MLRKTKLRKTQVITDQKLETQSMQETTSDKNGSNTNPLIENSSISSQFPSDNKPDSLVNSEEFNHEGLQSTHARSNAPPGNSSIAPSKEHRKGKDITLILFDLLKAVIQDQPSDVKVSFGKKVMNLMKLEVKNETKKKNTSHSDSNPSSVKETNQITEPSKQPNRIAEVALANLSEQSEQKSTSADLLDGQSPQHTADTKAIQASADSSENSANETNLITEKPEQQNQVAEVIFEAVKTQAHSESTPTAEQSPQHTADTKAAQASEDSSKNSANETNLITEQPEPQNQVAEVIFEAVKTQAHPESTPTAEQSPQHTVDTKAVQTSHPDINPNAAKEVNQPSEPDAIAGRSQEVVVNFVQSNGNIPQAKKLEETQQNNLRSNHREANRNTVQAIKETELHKQTEEQTTATAEKASNQTGNQVEYEADSTQTTPVEANSKQEAQARVVREVKIPAGTIESVLDKILAQNSFLPVNMFSPAVLKASVALTQAMSSFTESSESIPTKCINDDQNHCCQQKALTLAS